MVRIQPLHITASSLRADVRAIAHDAKPSGG